MGVCILEINCEGLGDWDIFYEREDMIDFLGDWFWNSRAEKVDEKMGSSFV